MSYIGQYLLGVVMEGLVFGFLFWVIAYITIESTSLRGALQAGLWSEALGNLPYLAGEPALSPPSIFMTFLAAILFVRLILRVGELTPGKAIYGTLTTYFVLTALVACS
ncbi:MAG: hypothetical protein AAF993_10270 [Pseudomonadota bacterium]